MFELEIGQMTVFIKLVLDIPVSIETNAKKKIDIKSCKSLLPNPNAATIMTLMNLLMNVLMSLRKPV